MGELTFDGIQFMIDGKPISGHWQGVDPDIPICGKISAFDSSLSERINALRTESDAMREKYKPIADKLVQEIHESFAPTPLSEDTAHQTQEAFKRLKVELSETYPIPTIFNKPTKRKHYKPRFTL